MLRVRLARNHSHYEILENGDVTLESPGVGFGDDVRISGILTILNSVP